MPVASLSSTDSQKVILNVLAGGSGHAGREALESIQRRFLKFDEYISHRLADRADNVNEDEEAGGNSLCCIFRIQGKCPQSNIRIVVQVCPTIPWHFIHHVDCTITGVACMLSTIRFIAALCRGCHVEAQDFFREQPHIDLLDINILQCIADLGDRMSKCLLKSRHTAIADKNSSMPSQLNLEMVREKNVRFLQKLLRCASPLSTL